jgi:hypothetical protein
MNRLDSENKPLFLSNTFLYWTHKRFSNGGIFAGTDAGVFYRDNYLSAWEHLNNGLPDCRVSDIEYIDTIDVLRIATFGRGIWETDLHPCTFYSNDPLNIEEDEVWTENRIMDRTIHIKAPATLIIKSIIKFPTMAKIEVEPGAKLVVDGGILTNYCSSMWLGIEVWGDSTQKQSSLTQGCVYFQNNAMLENSRIGITTCRKDNNGEIIWSTTGGIIHATNSTFRNNYKAIEFLTYHFPQSSTFHNVSFLTSGNFSDRVSLPSDFISLLEVKGILFEGCRFINLNTDTTLAAPESSGRGIYSIDAEYIVDEQCIGQTYPCTETIPSYFSGLRYGIKAENTNPMYTINVNKSIVNNNYRGIYLSGMDFASLTQNVFKLPKFSQVGPGAPTDTLYGVYLNSCSNYKIQENIFHSNAPNNGWNVWPFIG